MEKPVISGSSKVTVEYTDPSGVFPLIVNDLNQRLPLRNLHWNSSSRPLRSISFLHIELVPDSESVSQDTSALSALGTSIQAKDDGLASDNASASKSQAPASDGPRKERRHQIPGLRQTPYLKIYLLHCGDTESYKATSRKLLREWIKNHTPDSQNSTSTGKHENHDAFEWLIVHVVLPGDDASVSRLSGNPKSDSRWPTRTSSSVIEKIRADFNGTSKNSVDRVAQVKATGNSDTTKVSSRPSPVVNQSPEEDHRCWDDLVTKVKYLILASFDLRVSQYEEDIREKESQRNLPGWNFNTFFVLKEGLARGFESVGLIQDALTGYHELAAGLNAVISEGEANESLEQHTDLFRDHTTDVLDEFKQAALSEIISLEANHKSNLVTTELAQVPSRSHDFGSWILNTDSKPFRELILANNISAFEFQCYVFARQVSLLLRLANVVSEHPPVTVPAMNGTVQLGHMASAAESVPSSSEPPNLLILAEICQRALEFITSTGCALRHDFRKSVKYYSQTQDDHGSLSKTQIDDIIENLLASWIYSVSQCVLKKTFVQSLFDRLQPLLRQLKPTPDGEEGSYDSPVLSTNIIQRENLPSRTSSLPSGAGTASRSSSPENGPSVTSLNPSRLLPSASSHTGIQELAAQRADLSLLSRRALSSLGLRVGGWSSGWADLASELSLNDGAMDDVSLDNDSEGDGANFAIQIKSPNASTITGTRNEALLSAVHSKRAFYEAYEDLAVSALGHYVLGERHRSVEGIIADIAAVRFYLEDYAAAASYLHQTARFYATNDWSYLEMSVLEIYAQCLRRLDRSKEYINIALQILAKIVQHDITVPQHQKRGDVSGHLSGLISASKSLDHNISVPMDRYFSDIRLDPFLRHYKSRDGFQLSLCFHYLMPEGLQAEKVRVRIVTVGKEQRYEIWLAAEGLQRMEPGTFEVHLGSNVILPGWYIPDQITIQAEKILFTHDLSPPSEGPFFAGNHDIAPFETAHGSYPSQILIWAHSRALEARLSHSRSVNLEHTRSLVVDVASGWKDISEGRLQFRPATAGLRLHTAEAEVEASDTDMLDRSQPGSLKFGEISADTAVRIRIPYSLESDLKEIVVKVEIHYTTAEGSFTFACNPKISIFLPVGVNVQDVFKETALFSKFTISTADSIPLRISKCLLESTEDFEVAMAPLADSELVVFARQPLSLVTKIWRSARSQEKGDKFNQLQRKLLLQIEYCRLDQEIETAVEHSFSAALTDSPFRTFSRILIPALSAGLRSKISLQDFEMIGIMREIQVGIFQDYGWDGVLSGILPGSRPELADWLQSWHKEHKVIPIPGDMKASTINYLTVPVEIPQMQVVHTAHLRLVNALAENQAESSLVPISHAVPAELKIKHTRRWGTPAKFQDANEALDFCYEIQASPELWLVAGQRKAHFSAREDETLSFPIILLPQRTGHLLLPSIEVRPSRPHGSNEPSENRLSSAVPLSSCETDYRNQGETVLVVPNLRSTTVSLDPHGSTSGAWLVESESRHSQELIRDRP